MTYGTVFFINYSPIFNAVTCFRLFNLWIPTSWQRNACRCIFSQPIRVSNERCHHFTICRGSCSIHTKFKASLDTLSIGIHFIVFTTISRIHRISTPERRGICHFTLIHMTVHTVHTITNIFWCFTLCINKDRLTAFYHLTKSILRNFTITRWLMILITRFDFWRMRNLRLVIH